MALMKKVSITEARNNLRALIDGLGDGSAVLIVDRGRPVARLEPVDAGPGVGSERLARLVATGIVRSRIAKPPLPLFSNPPPRPAVGSSAVATLIEARRKSR